MLDGKENLFLKETVVMSSYLVLAINTNIDDANVHYTECDMAKLLQESCK